jgi:hypothetical protein
VQRIQVTQPRQILFQQCIRQRPDRTDYLMTAVYVDVTCLNVVPSALLLQVAMLNFKPSFGLILGPQWMKNFLTGYVIMSKTSIQPMMDAIFLQPFRVLVSICTVVLTTK